MRGGDAFFDERVPVVAVRALPEEFGAAVPAAQADVGIEIEHRVLREVAVVVDERRRVPQLSQRAPDGLMDAKRVWILHQRREQELERVMRMAARRQMPGQGKAGAPVLRVVVDQAAAQLRESVRRSGARKQSRSA